MENGITSISNIGDLEKQAKQKDMCGSLAVIKSRK